jgi:type I restriction enzyme S subunit
MNEVQGPYELQELPEGWEWTTIGEIIEPSKQKVNPSNIAEVPYIGLEHIEKDTGRLLGCGSSSGIRSTKSEFYIGDLLYGKLRPYLNKVCIPGFDGVCSTDILVYPKTPYILNEYLLYRFLSDDFVRYASQNVSGVQHPRVNIQTLSRFEISLPPLTEQRRIVNKIEELFTQLDAGVSALEKARAQLKRYRQSVLKAAVEGKLTEEWRRGHPDVEPASVLLERIEREREKSVKGRQKKFPPLDTSDLSELPEGWEWITLDSILSGIEAGKSFKCEERPPSVDEVGVLKVSAVTWGIFNELESKTCTNPERVDSRVFVKDNDFLFSRANTIELVGACVIVKRVFSRLMLSDKTLRFNFIETLPSWVLFMLRSRHGRNEIERLATGNQYSMRNISQNNIRSIRIPLPPLAEQHEIVSDIERCLSVVDQTEAAIETNLRRAVRLRQSILKKAFQGDLVQQNSNDEPASELLRRIKLEMAQNKLKDTPIKRKKKGDMSMDRTRRSLYDVLVEAKIEITTKELFSRSGFTLDNIDEFYQELRSEVSISSPRIEEIRPNSNEIYLKVRQK